MAILRIRNDTPYKLNIPYVDVAIDTNRTRDVVLTDIDPFYNDTRIQELMGSDPPKITVQLIEDSTPGAEGDAVLPFYTTSTLPPAAANPGMMVFNTTEQAVMYSDGTSWLVVTVVPVFRNSNMPNPASLPDGYLIYNTDNRVLWMARAGTWYYTTAGGIRTAPSHQIPPAGTVPRGAMFFDTDNEQLRISDGTNWQLVNSVQDYSTIANLPTVTDVGFGALGFTSRDNTLWMRVASAWQPTTGLVRFYNTFGDLPTNATWGNDERGAIAYINDDRTFVVWEGKYWRYLMQPQHFANASLPSASGYGTGHMVFDSTYQQHLCQVGGAWDGIQGIARSYSSGLRPPNASVPEGTIIWNTTSRKANFNIRGSRVDAQGVVDP